MQSITLYGVPHSMYTGRARSYLIKAGIPFRERAPSSKHFRKVVVPKCPVAQIRQRMRATGH